MAVEQPQETTITDMEGMAGRERGIVPGDIVRRIVALTEGYGLDEGRRVYKETARVMSFAAWWEAEVNGPVMRFFAEVRERERREGRAMELERLRAGAPHINIAQPQARAGIELPYGGGGIGQVNFGDNMTPAYYSQPSQT